MHRYPASDGALMLTETTSLVEIILLSGVSFFTSMISAAVGIGGGVMLLAVIATSISLVTLTSHSRIVLYQTVNIEKGDAQQSASQGCAGNRYTASMMAMLLLFSCFAYVC